MVPREVRPSPRSYAAWATNISAGAASEAGQHLTATVELLPLQPGDPKALEFDVPPSIDLATGDLRFTIKHRIYPDSSGEEAEDKWVSSAGLARVRVTVQDDGGTAGGGQDSTSADFTIFLDPVPAARNQNIKHPWKAAGGIPISFMAMDVDTDPVIADDWQHGDPWPYPTYEFLTYPQKGFMTDYVARATPDGQHRAIRFASKDLIFDYVMPKPGLIKVNHVPAIQVVAQSATAAELPDLMAVMDPIRPRLETLPPEYLDKSFNFVKTLIYVPFSSTFTGVDGFTFRVTDPDGHISNTASITIEIFEK